MKLTATTPTGHRAQLSARTRDILAARPDERADLLAQSEDAAAIVPRLAPTELLFILRSASPEALIEILNHARPQQVRFILDVDAWQGDEVSAQSAERWLVTFEDVETAVMDRWLKVLEVADLAVLMGRVVRASLADEDGMPEHDPASGTTSFTLDGAYYFTMSDKAAPSTRRILTILYKEDPAKYMRLLELLLMGFDVEDEETALQFRRARLAEEGFPDFAEAQAVYALMSAERLKALPARDPNAPDPFENRGFAPPLYALAAIGERAGYLRQAIALMRDGEEILSGELALLTNKVVAADAMDLADVESYRKAALKVSGYISIGLESLFGADIEAMGRALSRHWAEHLFQAGFTKVNEMARQARGWLVKGWPAGKRERLLILDEPLTDALNAILRPRPQWIEETPEGYVRRDFNTLAEVELARRAVEKADFVGRYILAVVNFNLASLDASQLKLETDMLKARTVFLTALANAALGRGFMFCPIERAEANAALSRLWTPGAPPRSLNPELYRAALAWSEEKIELTGREPEFLREFLSESIELLEDEFGNLPEGTEPDPRFLTAIWLV